MGLSLKIWFSHLEECSLGWWPNEDRVVLVHCRQRQQSLLESIVFSNLCWFQLFLCITKFNADF